MSVQRGAGKRIVVGVDGSESSEAALRWAVREAELTDSTVETVLAWHYPTLVGAYGWAPIAALEAADEKRMAGQMLERAIGEAVAPASTVKVSRTVIKGHPAEVLLDVADGAELLVVGSRGHGGFTGALLGSVSQHCARHSPCTIVIVRDAQAVPTDAWGARSASGQREGTSGPASTSQQIKPGEECCDQ